MKPYEEYFQGIVDHLARLEEKKIRYLYRINEKVPDEYIRGLIRHFSTTDKYSIETKKCMSCKNTWDVIITIKYFGS